MTQKNAKNRAARARQEKLGGKYQHHLRQVGGGGDTPPLPSPPRRPGELASLTFTCLLCKAPRDLPLRDFASGTIVCPNHDPPRQFAIPNNDRYRRLAREIDTVSARHDGVTVAAVPVNTEPYLVLYRSPRVEVSHVDTWETRLVAVGHWNGPGGRAWFSSDRGRRGIARLLRAVGRG